MATQIQMRRDTAANWASVNPILASGEFGFETDTLKLKLGNGSTSWNSLAYYATTPADNSITFAKLYSEFTATQAMPGTAVDWSAAVRFTKTISTNETWTFTNLRVGVKFLEVTGNYAITLPSGFTFAGGTRASSGVTLIQVVCTNSSTPVGWYVLLKAS